MNPVGFGLSCEFRETALQYHPTPLREVDAVALIIRNFLWAFFHFSSEEILQFRKKAVPLCPGKSYTTSSPGTPPGLDRSNGTGL